MDEFKVMLVVVFIGYGSIFFHAKSVEAQEPEQRWTLNGLLEDVTITSPTVRVHAKVKAGLRNARGERIEIVDALGRAHVPQIQVRFGR